MEEWQKRLHHDRDLRDCYVAMGNKAPDREDPPTGLVTVPLRRFDGRIYREFLSQRGHDSGDYEQCKCRYQRPPKGASQE